MNVQQLIDPFYCCCIFGSAIMCIIDNTALDILVCIFQYRVHVFLLVFYLEMQLLDDKVC